MPPAMAVSRWRAPDGWMLRRFDLPPAPGAAPRGSLLFLTGRGDFLEKYLETYDHWRRAGWRVSGFDWRGQGGSGRLLADRLVGHADDFGILVDDLAAFVREWLRDTPGPHVAIGHSMGGHLLLRLLARGAAGGVAGIDAAVLVAPMLGLGHAPMPAWLARLVARLACAVGLGKRQAWREGERPGARGEVRQTNLTGSIERYSDEGWWREHDPDVALGPPSWGWLRAALNSTALLDRPGALDRVTLPVLLLASTRDRLVSGAAIERAAARLPDARIARFDGAHELLREADPVRDRALALVDAFLDERAPAR